MVARQHLRAPAQVAAAAAYALVLLTLRNAMLTEIIRAILRAYDVLAGASFTWLRLAEYGNDNTYIAGQTHRIGLLSSRPFAFCTAVWTWNQHK
jgi:hypothetical protein